MANSGETWVKANRFLIGHTESGPAARHPLARCGAGADPASPDRGTARVSERGAELSKTVTSVSLAIGVRARRILEMLRPDAAR